VPNTTVRAVASVLHVALQPIDAGRSGEKASRVRTPQRPVAEPSPELPRGTTATRWSKTTSNASPGPNPTCRRTRQQEVRFQRVHNTATRGMLVEVEREGDRGKKSTYVCEPPSSALKSSNRPEGGGQRTLAAQNAQTHLSPSVPRHNTRDCRRAWYTPRACNDHRRGWYGVRES
jgi:hypothetical protein